MHNAAYEFLKIDDQFVFLGARIKIENIEIAVESMRKMGIHGLACTIPHKIAIMKFLDEIDPIAEKIGAVNTVVNRNGKIVGYNTDWLGAINPLEKITRLSGKTVAVIGAGGAARAVVFGLTKKAAKVTIFNRTKEKADQLAKEFNCHSESIDNKEAIKKVDIIVNTTSVGMKPLENKTPIATENIGKNQIVFDIVYSPSETKLLKEAKKKGAKIIYGKEMLLYQGTAQFEIFTGHKAPVEVMRRALSV
jgi:shikimate dehydrogenase